MFGWEAPSWKVVEWRASPGAAGRGCTLEFEVLDMIMLPLLHPMAACFSPLCSGEGFHSSDGTLFWWYRVAEAFVIRCTPPCRSLRSHRMMRHQRPEMLANDLVGFLRRSDGAVASVIRCTPLRFSCLPERCGASVFVIHCTCPARFVQPSNSMTVVFTFVL